MAVLVLGACLLAQAWWIPLLAFGLMAALTVWAGRTPWPLYARMLLIPVGFLLLGLPAVALSLTAAPVAAGSFQVLGLHVTATQAGLETAGGILARTLGAVSCLYFLALSTPLPDILGLLRRCGIPVLFLEILALVYRFVFVLLDTALDMRRAQSLRLGYTGLRTSYRAWGGGLLANLLVRACRRTGLVYTALSLRGYEGSLEVLDTPRRLNPASTVAAAALGGSLLVLAVAFQ